MLEEDRSDLVEEEEEVDDSKAKAAKQVDVGEDAHH